MAASQEDQLLVSTADTTDIGKGPGGGRSSSSSGGAPTTSGGCSSTASSGSGSGGSGTLDYERRLPTKRSRGTEKSSSVRLLTGPSDGEVGVPLRFGFEQRIANQANLTRKGVWNTAGALLDHVGQLVNQQPSSVRTVGLEVPRSQYDLRSASESQGAEPLDIRALMDSHRTEIRLLTFAERTHASGHPRPVGWPSARAPEPS